MDPEKEPKALDVTNTAGLGQGTTYPTVYDRTGDELRVCYPAHGRPRAHPAIPCPAVGLRTTP